MNIKRLIKKRKNTTCPICGAYSFSEPYDICPNCGWENDPVQAENPDMAGGANKLSLNEARKQYEGGRNE